MTQSNDNAITIKEFEKMIALEELFSGDLNANDDAKSSCVLEFAELWRTIVILDSPREFFRFAIKFSRVDCPHEACLVILKGLENYPNDMNLQASYLENAIDSNEIVDLAECEEISERLQVSIENSSKYVMPDIRIIEFLMDYFLERYEDPWWLKEAKYSKDEEYERILSLTGFMTANYKDNERSWVLKARVVSLKTHDADIEKSILIEAIRKIDMCPRCALRLADIYVEKADYKNALKQIELCIGLSEKNPSIKKAYAYFLSGFCKASIFRKQYGKRIRPKSIRDKEGMDNYIDKIPKKIKREVDEIYDDFSMAIGYPDKSLNSSYRERIEEHIFVVKQLSGIEYTGCMKPEDSLS